MPTTAVGAQNRHSVALPLFPTALICAFAILTGFAISAPAVAKPLIGVSLVEQEDAGAEVLRVRQGFPAHKAGLEPGDHIVEVNGEKFSSARAVADAIAAGGEGPTRLRVMRSGAPIDVAIRPWIAPNEKLDAELFPYPSPSVSESGTALKARIVGRDYDIVSASGVFTLLRSIGVDESYQGRRVAFRARVLNCDHLSGAPTELLQPSSSPLYSFAPVQSLLFDPEHADLERLKCETYFDQMNLDLSSPIVVVAGRLTTDDNGVLSSGGPVLLVDAMLFDNSHVTLGEQVVGLVEFVNSMVSMME